MPIRTELANLFPKKKSGLLFELCYYAFRSALGHTDILLPDGQLSHVLRHTFSSHFIMSEGDILVPQRILGHTDIKMTMMYSHFSQERFEEVLKLIPLNKLN